MKQASLKDNSFSLCGRNQYFVSDRIGGLFVQSTLGALSESVVHKLVLLDFVNLFGTSSGRCSGVSTSIVDSSGPVGSGSQSWLAEIVETHVFVLFLDPVNFRVFVFLELRDHLVVWEWSDLFNSSDSNIIFKSSCSSFLNKIIVDLSRAEHQSLDIIGILGCRAIFADKSLHFSASDHVGPWRASFGKSKKRFGSHENEWLAEWKSDLSSMNVHNVGWSRWVANNPVGVVELFNSKISFFPVAWEEIGIVVLHLKESFDSA